MNEPSKNRNPYSFEDIERYLQGKLSPAEMHELEKAAVQDPFLADAIEGYQSIGQEDVRQDLASIHDRLSSGPAKVIPATAKQNTWWRVAAAVILLAGAGVLGFKLFKDKNNTQELAKTETIAPVRKDTPQTVAAIGSNKDSTVTLQTNDQLANNIESAHLKKSAAIDNPVSLDITKSQPVAALSAKPYSYNKTRIEKDTALFDKIAARDMVAMTTPGGRSTGLLAQANGTREVNAYSKTFDPALAAKAGSIHTILANESITGGAGVIPTISIGKGKTIKGDTINPDRSKMPLYSQVGYQKPGEPAVTSLSSLSTLTVAGNINVGSRNFISFDTSVLTDQKKMYAALSSNTTPPGTSRFEVSKPKNDSIESLSEIVVTRPAYHKSPKSELNRSSSAAPAGNAKKEVVPDSRESAVAVNPTGGWYSFTKYLSDKIATQKDVSEHGSVEVKMDISAGGKVSKVRILNSFNTQLNPILIKAIRKGPRWKSTDYLEKKDFTFKVDL